MLLAVLDGTNEGVSAIFGTCTAAEARQVALCLANAFVACCEPEDRDGLRTAATELRTLAATANRPASRSQGLARFGPFSPGDALPEASEDYCGCCGCCTYCG
jgi:hypothetical protein